MLGGGTSTRDVRYSSYTWEVDYRQDFARWFAGSVAYLNEGHIPNHHRDGTAFQLWGSLPLFDDRVFLSAGVGPYYFYDTQPLGGGGSADVHGTAALYSVSAVAYLTDRWFIKGTLNRIATHRDVQTNTAAAGLGFWFGQGSRPMSGRLGDKPGESSYVTPNEIAFFGGQSVVNTLFSPKAFAYAGEYRRGVVPHIDWTLSAIHEGDPRIVRRDGVATQAWVVNTFFRERVCVGIGVGPYLYIDRRHPNPRTRITPAAAAPLVSLTAAISLSDHWLVRAIFDRVTSNYNRDSDIFLVGLGYRWGAASR